MEDERRYRTGDDDWNPRIDETTGISIPAENAGQWERTSLRLKVSQRYADIFTGFVRYYADEMDAIGDYSLGQELDVLDLLTQRSRW